MKKFGIALAAALFTLPVMADEQIKLAAALGSGGAEATAGDASASAASAASTSATAATANMVAVGFIAAAGLAVAADVDSSDSH